MKMKKIIKVIAGVGAVVASVVAIILLIVFAVTAEAVKVAQSQIGLICANNLTAAYALTSSGFQEDVSPEDFLNFVQENPILKQNTKMTFTAREFQDGWITLTGKLIATGNKSPIIIELVKEDGQWQVFSIELKQAYFIWQKHVV